MSLKKLMSLAGHKAFITGSSDGIGKAIAWGLAEQGADVVIHARQNVDECKKLASEIESLHRVRCEYVTGDIANQDSLDKIYERVEGMGNIDILVLNASIQIKQPFLEIKHDDYVTQLSANLWSTVRLIQLFYPHMEQKKWGRILTLGSVQQLKPHKEMAVYAASKSAVANLVKNLALQFAIHGVTINNLAPGVIHTKRNEEALGNQAYADIVRSKIPAGFFAEPQDCAGMAALLCSDAARYITGQDIFCDGGMGL